MRRDVWTYCFPEIHLHKWTHQATISVGDAITHTRKPSLPAVGSWQFPYKENHCKR